MLNIDAAILLFFLLTNLVVGLHYGRGVRTFKTYATGNRNFSSTAVVATIVATWISGSIFAFNLSGVYSEGLPFIVMMFGMPLALAIIGLIYTPRMGEFAGCTSLSDAMGMLYGRHVRYITALCGIWLAAGVVGLQIKLLANLLEWNFGITNSTVTSAIATGVIIAYSAFGGIRSVTFTDIVQAITFSALVPSLCIVLWHTISTPYNVQELIQTDPRFQIQSIFKLKWLALFIWSAVPWMVAPTFQRILITKNLLQARRTFITASVIAMLIIALTSWIAILLLASNRELNPEKLILHLLDDYSFTGLRGLIIAGIAAMVMGSADSYIHSAAVQFANDLPTFSNEPISDKHKLWKSRFFAIAMGVFGLFISLSQKNLLDLALLVTNFYLPIVTVPLTLAILGFRTTSETVIAGMVAGLTVATSWYFFYTETTGIDSAAPGMLANILTLFFVHYISRQQGGWNNIKDTALLKTLRLTRRHKYTKFFNEFYNFSIYNFTNKDTPTISTPYVQFGFFSVISIFASMYALPHNLRVLYSELLDPIYNAALFISGTFLLYPLWNKYFQQWKYRGLVWHLAVFLTLVCFGGFMFVISNFNQFTSIILTINLIVVCMLTRWEIALPMVFLGTYTNYLAYDHYIETTQIMRSSFIDSVQLKILYGLLLFASFLIAFIKPKQENQDKLQSIAKELEEKAIAIGQEARKALEVKMEFINNMNHEVRTPIQGVSAMAANLVDHWDELSTEDRKNTARILDQSAHRFFTLIDSILNFSDLASNKLEMQYQDCSIKELLINALEHCHRYYKHSDNTQFEINLEDDDMVLNCDPHYLQLVMVNLIANAIKHSPEGVIEVTATHSNQRDEMGKEDYDTPAISITVKDNGIGIPTGEEYSIFLPFTLSSYTDNKAGGRGMGLALAHLIIRQHGGCIWAENNSDGKGATFNIRI